MQAEKALREKGEKTNRPRVLLLAQSGKAASLIGNVALIDRKCKKDIYLISFKVALQFMEPSILGNMEKKLSTIHQKN